MSGKEIETAKVLISKGRFSEARSSLKLALKAYPKNPNLLFLLGVTLYKSDQAEQALKFLNEAIKVQPNFAEAHFNLGTILMEKGDLKAAVIPLRHAFKLKPQDIDVLRNFCNTLIGLGEADQAIKVFQNVIAKNSKNPQLLLMYGVMLSDLRRWDASVSVLLKVTRSMPEWSEAQLNLSNSLMNMGDLEGAKEAITNSLSLDPGQPEGYFILGQILEKNKELKNAKEHYRSAIALNPKYLPAIVNLGRILRGLSEFEEAMSLYSEAIVAGVDSPEIRLNLGNILQDVGRLDEAGKSFRYAIKLKPSYPEAYINLGKVLMGQGQSPEALVTIRRGLDIAPGLSEGGSNYLMCLNYISSTSALELEQESRFWGKRYRNTNRYFKWPNTKEPDRKLKICYLSPDFRIHSVSYFFEPLLAGHNREGFEIYCYSNVSCPDETTYRLKRMSDQWRNIWGLQDGEVIEKIMADGIDIFVDLAGHTSNNRLDIFAQKPAPLQFNWLGYPGTTGLETMDYRITDYEADPEGTDAPEPVETLLRLKNGFLCYRPHAGTPDVVKRRSGSDGFVTFGSYNNLAKLTPETVEVWSDIISKIPNSRLRLKSKSFSCNETKAIITSMFSAHGLDKSRLLLFPQTEFLTDHLADYRHIDIALDTFPYNGTTTTFEALWMGVPVVVLSGQRHASRVGRSILTHLGRCEWIAQNIEEYKVIAVGLAKNLEVLNSEREKLRSDMLDSPLCDEIGFTRELEAAYRTAWQNWCSISSNQF